MVQNTQKAVNLKNYLVGLFGPRSKNYFVFVFFDSDWKIVFLI